MQQAKRSAAAAAQRVSRRSAWHPPPPEPVDDAASDGDAAGVAFPSLHSFRLDDVLLLRCIRDRCREPLALAIAMDVWRSQSVLSSAMLSCAGYDDGGVCLDPLSDDDGDFMPLPDADDPGGHPAWSKKQVFLCIEALCLS